MDAASRREFITSGAAVALPFTALAAKSGAAPRAGLLAGKRAVIYGAAGAIGSAVARAFAREGAELFLAGRTPEHVEALAAELAKSGARASAAGVDALDKAAIDKHLEDVAR